MVNVEKVMKGKQSFKDEMDKRLSKEDSHKAWQSAGDEFYQNQNTWRR